MTTIYVSNSTDNGFGMGSDASADATNIATPFLTLTKAVTSGGVNDATIIINDGEYNEATYVTPNKTNLTIQSYSRHGAIIRNNASATVRVFHQAVTPLTIKDIVIDADNKHSGCFTTGTLTDLTTTFSGTKFLNPTASFFNLTRTTNVTMDSEWEAEATSLSANGFIITETAALCTAGTISISDGSITVTDITSGGKSAINISSTDLAGVDVDINNVTITLSKPTNSAQILKGISVNTMQSVTIHDNAITINDSSIGVGIVVAQNSAVDTTDSCKVYNNTITVPPTETDGSYGLLVGTDGADTDAITNPRVFNNIINGGDHGLTLGSVTNGHAYSNSLTNNVLGVLFKETTTCKATGNIVTDCTGSGALRFKADTDGVMANNLVVYNSGASVSSAIALYADDNDAHTVDTTGAGYYNNLIYANETISDWATVAAGSDAVFNSNNYYNEATGDSTMGTNPFNYQGTGRADIATWISAEATVSNEIETDPVLVNNATTAASLLGTGVNWGATMYLMEDYSGKPFPAYDVDIGAVQGTDSANHPFAPVNL